MAEKAEKAEKRKSPETPRPTDGELAILRVLWSRGPSTVREVHEALSASQESGYTSGLKQLPTMMDKGLVARACGGSSVKLVLRARSGRRATAQEPRDIRALLDELKQGEPK